MTTNQLRTVQRLPRPRTASPQLSRNHGEHLGLRDLVLFYVVVTLSLRWLPLAAAAGPSTIVIWLLGVLVVFLPLALCVMELSSRYPQEGGMYVWSKRAFGDFGGLPHGMDLLDQQPAVLSGAAVFRGQQCAVCRRHPLAWHAKQPVLLHWFSRLSGCLWRWW